MTAVQNEKTIQFWDDYYTASSADTSNADSHPNKEWILHPSLDIFERLYELLPPPAAIARPHAEEAPAAIATTTTNATSPSLPKREPVRILEIGCGTSRLARDFLLFCRHQKGRHDIFMCATDVSLICLAQNRIRDRELLVEDTNNNDCDDITENMDEESGFLAAKDEERNLLRQEKGRLVYDFLNITIPLVKFPVAEEYETLSTPMIIDDYNKQHDLTPPTESKFAPASFDMILDKGCLDTFLFRTRQRGEHKDKLIRTVLDNIHYLLKDPSNNNPTNAADYHTDKNFNESNNTGSARTRGGVYTIQTPRAKFRPVKEYPGFAKVERMILDDNQGILVPTGAGEIKQNGKLKREKLYLYSCYKGTTQHADVPNITTSGMEQQSQHAQDIPVVSPPLEDTDACQKCGLTFLDFRKGEDLKGRGLKFWTRLFRGHGRHCKGNENP